VVIFHLSFVSYNSHLAPLFEVRRGSWNIPSVK